MFMMNLENEKKVCINTDPKYIWIIQDPASRNEVQYVWLYIDI